MVDAKLHIREVIFKKLRHVNFRATLIELLVEVDGSDSKLKVIKIRRNLDHKIVCPHIPQKCDYTSLIELYKLFCNALRIIIRISNKRLGEYVTGDTDDMFFDKRLSVYDIIYLIGRDNLLQL